MSIKNDLVLKELNKSFKTLKSPKRWIRSEFHLKKDGQDSYCLLGSLGFRRIPEGHYGHKERIPKLKAALYLVKALPKTFTLGDGYSFSDISGFNDTYSTKHKDILNLIKKAIALRKKDIKNKKETVQVPRGITKYKLHKL